MPCLTTIRFGDAVLLLRRRGELSQTDLAARVHVTPSAISRIESGRCTPPADAVEQLANGLGASELERDWLHQLGAHARMLRCAQRERVHWQGSVNVMKHLDHELVAINRHQERSEAPT